MPIGKIRARVLVATAGTWGDIMPFVELGRRLCAKGHEVTLACPSGLHGWVERAGLKAAVFDGDFGKEKAQEKAGNWDHWNRPGHGKRRGHDEPVSSEAGFATLVEKLERNCRDLAELSIHADLLLAPTNCPEGRLVHEMTGIPWFSVILIPEEILRAKKTDDAGFAAVMSQLRRGLGIREPVPVDRGNKPPTPAIFACSKAFGSANTPGVRQTGFWFYEDPEWARWRPDEKLLRFMEAGEAPLVLSFSSLPLVDPREVLRIHVRAARLLERRLVIQQGWSGFSRELLPVESEPDQIYMADFIPHDWFFSRAAGLITHGGIGTLGRALRQGCPVLVEPYGNDQFFNALLVKRLGYGVAVHPYRITAESLAQVIAEKLWDPRLRENVRKAAAIIREEDGLSQACAIIESRLEEVVA